MSEPIPIHDALELVAARLVAAGFELRHVSNTTETRYFALPGREAVLRLSSHHGRKGARGDMPPIAGRITLSGLGCARIGHVSVPKLEREVAMAIGFYVMRSAMAPEFLA
jgi:hypothetical protein